MGVFSCQGTRAEIATLLYLSLLMHMALDNARDFVEKTFLGPLFANILIKTSA